MPPSSIGSMSSSAKGPVTEAMRDVVWWEASKQLSDWGSSEGAILGMRTRSDEASKQLFDHYFPRLHNMANGHLERMGACQAIADAGDVALQAIAEVLLRNPDGILEKGHRDDLAKMLSRVVWCRAINQVQRHPPSRPPTYGRGTFRAHDDADSAADGDFSQQISSQEPSPEEQAIHAEDVQKLYERLSSPGLRQVLKLKWVERYTNEEIAEILGCAVATVERRVSLIKTELQEWYEVDLTGPVDASSSEGAP